MKVEIINQLKDNYSFVLYNDTLKSCVIDPADSNPIINFTLENNLTIEDIFITHHHKDHTSGVKGILNAFPEVNIHSPSAQIENTRFVLRDGDEVNSCLNTFRIIKTPGHTLDHIIYYDENNGVLFCGDTLFRLGCGRVFEGTLNEMFNSLKKKYVKKCYCGKDGCLETYISGPGFSSVYNLRFNKNYNSHQILDGFHNNEKDSIFALNQYVDHLARGLSLVCNILDPDVIVLGGGMSNINFIYENINDALKKYVFTDTLHTKVVKNIHGDSSGVRGAAWLS